MNTLAGTTHRLTIRREGSLLQVITDREVSPVQIAAVRAVLDIGDITYDDVLALLDRAKRQQPEGGIEQYQRESR